MKRLGVGGAVVDGSYVSGDIGIDEGTIAAVGLATNGSGGRSRIAVPGFVDVQVNGYAGVDFLNADADAWLAATHALAADGVSAFLPTLITGPPEITADALRTAEKATAAQSPTGARVLGVHLEGPFISPVKSGTHPVEWLRLPDPALVDSWLATGLVRLITLAPELPGALELIRRLDSRGVVVSAGHSDADAAQAHAAFDAGARSVTHLFNAMRPIAGRDPGLAGVALGRRDVFVQVICDGVHLAGDTVRLVLASAADRIMLVTDAIAATGVGDATVRLGEVSVEVRGMEARRSDGTLAGSVLTMCGALRGAVAAGASVELAATAASTRPAQLLGLPYAALRPGDPADLVILDDDLHLETALLAGLPVERER